MSLINSANLWFYDHQGIFKTLLFGMLFGMLVLFTVVFVHVLKGVRFTFVIILNVAVLQSIICYIAYAYFFLNNKSWKLWYFTSMLSFALYHWILAYRYFAASREMPYIFDG